MGFFTKSQNCLAIQGKSLSHFLQVESTQILSAVAMNIL
jgi:hypothetical protein